MSIDVAATPVRPTPPPAPARRWWHGLASVEEVRWAAASTLLFAAGGVVHLADGPTWLFWGLYLACYVTGGWAPAREGLAALRERRLDVDLLMIVAAIGAAAIGQVFDGALLIVLFATSGALEAVATRRTEDSVRSLLDLAPPRATRLDAAEDETVVDAADLVPGDVVLVRPGERLAADGTGVGGSGDVDQSTITGEPRSPSRPAALCSPARPTGSAPSTSASTGPPTSSPSPGSSRWSRRPRRARLARSCSSSASSSATR